MSIFIDVETSCGETFREDIADLPSGVLRTLMERNPTHPAAAMVKAELAKRDSPEAA
jgi:hypothetical protein